MLKVCLFCTCFRLLRFSQGSLYLLSLAHVCVNILESADDPHLSARHLHLGEFDAEVFLTAVPHFAQIILNELMLVAQPIYDHLEIKLFSHALAVAFCHRRVDVILLGIRILHAAQGFAELFGFISVPGDIAAVQREVFSLHIADQPYRMVGFAERVYYSLPDSHVCL